MLLQFCDKCGRPLSEGCIARGEAIERKGELICSHCVSSEQTTAAMQAATDEVGQETTGPLGHYEQAVWSCDSCGIPVTALDLIEGRAARIGEALRCSRCAADAKGAPEPEPPTAPRKPKPQQKPARPNLPRAAVKPAAISAPRRSTSAAEEFVAETQSEQKRPILPLVMFAIILPMFAVSLYFAITSQQKLNEVMGKRGNTEQAPDRRNRHPREQLQPTDFGNETPADNQPEPGPPDNAEPGPSPEAHHPEAPKQRPLPPGVVDDLVAIEKQLAAPSITKLQSKDLGEVWEGLIEVGSRRLIAARPYVRALLRDHDDKTRALACRVCGMLNDKEALPTISRMVESDPDESVRIEARKARDRMTGEATRELRDLTDKELRKMLEDIQRELDRRGERND
jgi:hypothetical protein